MSTCSVSGVVAPAACSALAVEFDWNISAGMLSVTKSIFLPVSEPLNSCLNPVTYGPRKSPTIEKYQGYRLLPMFQAGDGAAATMVGIFAAASRFCPAASPVSSPTMASGFDARAVLIADTAPVVVLCPSMGVP